MAIMQSRRRFVTNAAVAGAAGFATLGAINRAGGGKSLAAEPPPEVSTIRIDTGPVVCIAPQYVAEELLHAEGFTDIRYIDSDASPTQKLVRNEADWALEFVPAMIDGIGRRSTGDNCCRRARRLLRTVRARSYSRRCRPQRPDCWCGSRQRDTETSREHHGELRRPRPAEGYPLGQGAVGKAYGPFHRPEDRCVPGLAAPAAGTPGPRHRPFHREQCNRPSLVAILLLHGDRPHGIHPQVSGCNQAHSARYGEGAPNCARPNPSEWHNCWSIEVIRHELITRYKH